jgi:hypothetical protein
VTVLIQQRSDSDCVLASIAMAKGVEWGSLWNDDDLKKVVEDKGVGDVGPWLERAGWARGTDYRLVYVYGGADQQMFRNALWPACCAKIARRGVRRRAATGFEPVGLVSALCRDQGRADRAINSRRCLRPMGLATLSRV